MGSGEDSNNYSSDEDADADVGFPSDGADTSSDEEDGFKYEAHLISKGGTLWN